MGVRAFRAIYVVYMPMASATTPVVVGKKNA